MNFIPTRVPLIDLSRRVTAAEVLHTRAAVESEAQRLATFAQSAKVNTPSMAAPSMHKHRA